MEFTSLILLAVGLVLGVFIGGLVKWSALRGNTSKQAEEREHMSNAFKVLATDALRQNSDDFLQAAGKNVENLVKPLAERLTKFEKDVQGDYGGIRQLMATVTEGQNKLVGETRSLTQALRTPQVRGRWGELTLRRVVELSGMVDRCDFQEQASFASEGSTLRPDLVVMLPNERRIVLDAKTPLDAYLDSSEADTEEIKAAALKRHARLVRDRVDELARKSYWDALGYTPEFVVLFLPGEFFLGPALQEDAKLLDHAFGKRIIIASPSTLMSLLLTVAYGWREEQLSENARRISEMGKELHDRMETWASHYSRMGKALGNAVDAFNGSVGSLEKSVMPSARRFKELGVSSSKEIPELGSLDKSLRVPSVAESD